MAEVCEDTKGVRGLRSTVQYNRAQEKGDHDYKQKAPAEQSHRNSAPLKNLISSRPPLDVIPRCVQARFFNFSKIEWRTLALRVSPLNKASSSKYFSVLLFLGKKIGEAE